MYGSTLYNKELFCEFDFESGFYGEPEAHIINIGASSLVVPGVEAPSHSAGAVLTGALSETPYLNITFADPDVGSAATISMLSGVTAVPGPEAPSTAQGLLLKGPLLGALLVPCPPTYMFSQTFITGTPTPYLYETGLYDENILEDPFTTYTVNSYNTGMAIATCLVGGSIQQSPGGFVFEGDMLGSFAAAHNMRSTSIAVMEMDSVDVLISDSLDIEPAFYWPGEIAKSLHNAQEMPHIPQLIRTATEVAGFITPDLDTTTLIPMSFMGCELRVLVFPDGPVIAPAHLATELNGMLYRDTGRSDTITYGSRYNYTSRGAQYLGLSGWDELYIDGNKIAGVLPGLFEGTLTCGGSQIEDIYVDYLFALHEPVVITPYTHLAAYATLLPFEAITYGYKTYLDCGYLYKSGTATTPNAFASLLDGEFTISGSDCYVPGCVLSVKNAQTSFSAMPPHLDIYQCYCIAGVEDAELYCAHSDMFLTGVATGSLSATEIFDNAPTILSSIASYYEAVVFAAQTCDAAIKLDSFGQLMVCYTYTPRTEGTEQNTYIVMPLATEIYDLTPAIYLDTLRIDSITSLDASARIEIGDFAEYRSGTHVVDTPIGAISQTTDFKLPGFELCVLSSMTQDYPVGAADVYIIVDCKHTMLCDCSSASYLDGELLFVGYVNSSVLYTAGAEKYSIAHCSIVVTEPEINYDSCASQAEITEIYYAQDTGGWCAEYTSDVHAILELGMSEFMFTTPVAQKGVSMREVAVYAEKPNNAYTDQAHALNTKMADFSCTYHEYTVYAEVVDCIVADSPTVLHDIRENCVTLTIGTTTLVCGAPSVDYYGYVICTLRTVLLNLEYRYAASRVLMAQASCDASSGEFAADITAECLYINLIPTPFWYDFVIEYDFSGTDPTEMAFIF